MLTIAHQRLHQQRISQPDFETPGAVLGWFGAIQGQDYTGAKWSLGLRLPGSTDADIEGAIADKIILRTWLMRGTLHLVTAADLRWIQELVAPRMLASLARRHQELELDEATFARSNDLLLKALEGGQTLDRAQLLDMLEANGISTKGQRAPHLLQKASLDGLICQGAAPKSNPLYMLLDEATPERNPLGREEALAKIALCYFTSRGPATVQDFAGWLGLPIGEARIGLETVKAQLVEANIDGQIYWCVPAAAEAAAPATYLLPGFDEYILGYKDRSAVLEPQHAGKICPGGNGVFFPTIVIDGQVVGVWKRTLKKDKVIITLEPFNPLTESERDSIAAAVPRYGEFLGLEAVIA